MKILVLVVFSIACLSTGRAETLRLRDGRSVEGMIEHVYNGIYTVRTSEGPQTFGRHEIAGIDFPPDIPPAPAQALPATPSETFFSTLKESDAPYGTPMNTFKTWRQAAIQGDLKEMVKCYASFQQRQKTKELKALSKDDWEKMRAATANTEFLPKAPLYQGDRAFMEVAWNLNLQGDTQTLKFILEKDQWKLLQ